MEGRKREETQQKWVKKFYLKGQEVEGVPSDGLRSLGKVRGESSAENSCRVRKGKRVVKYYQEFCEWVVGHSH